jgi:hypothetical protein
MNRPSENMQELEEAISRFATMFELVFDNDWEMTKICISDSSYVEDNATFINPGVNDEDNNWGNRGSLLSAHRNLVKVLEKNGIPHSIAFGD